MSTGRRYLGEGTRSQPRQGSLLDQAVSARAWCSGPALESKETKSTHCVGWIPVSEPRHAARDEDVLAQQRRSTIGDETLGGRRHTSPNVVVAFTLNSTDTNSAVFGSLVPLPSAPVWTAIAWCAPTVTDRLLSGAIVKLRQN